MGQGFENKCDDCGEVLFEGDEINHVFLEVYEINGCIISRFCGAMCLRSLLCYDDRREWVIKRIEKL